MSIRENMKIDMLKIIETTFKNKEQMEYIKLLFEDLEMSNVPYRIIIDTFTKPGKIEFHYRSEIKTIEIKEEK